MRMKTGVMALAALLLAPASFADDLPAGMIIAYPTHSELDVPDRFTDDGVGYGFRGWSVDGLFMVHGEYQTTTLSDARRLDSLRIGGGLAAPLGGSIKVMAKVEYIDFGREVDEDGFGAHLGLMFRPDARFGLFGTVGALRLNDTEGLEFNIGGHFAIRRDVAVVLDYRRYVGEYDVRGFAGDFEVTDLRAGVAYAFY